ncbi:MAG: hypothetical protein HC875_35140 [Anaerolineales bacterium]|nr:hypothetical protein [Anaerolineales bacterium]
MTSGSKIYEVKCPSCGAPLSMAGARTTCDYCGAVLEREKSADPEPTIFSKTHEAQVIVIQTGRTTTSVSRKSGGSSCLSTLFILLLLVGIGGGGRLVSISGAVVKSDRPGPACQPEPTGKTRQYYYGFIAHRCNSAAQRQ